MKIFRIVKARYADGLYASGRAGRWNLEDQHVLYASSSRALATLELVVHQSRIDHNIDYQVLVIDVPDNVLTIDLGALPENWRKLSAYSYLQQLGSQWYEKQESLILQVPSAVIPQEHNFIINTRHPDYQQVKLLEAEEYFWDKRI